MADTGLMARPKKTDGGNPDPRKPHKMVRIRGPYIGPLEQLSDETASDVTEIVNRYVREGLERDGRWPPARGQTDE